MSSLEFEQDNLQQDEQSWFIVQTYAESFLINPNYTTFSSETVSPINNLTVLTNFCTRSDREIEENKTSDYISDCNKNRILFNTDFRFEIPTKNNLGTVIDRLNTSIPFGIFENLQNRPKSLGIGLPESYFGFPHTTPISLGAEWKRIDDFFENLSQKFKIINKPQFRNFFDKAPLTLTPNFRTRFAEISDFSYNFLIDEGIQFFSSVESNIDQEDPDIENIRITFRTKNTDIKKCRDILKQLITKIAEKDKDALKYIHLQIVPE